VRWLYAELAQSEGITAYPTGANFVCFRVDNGMTARQVQRRLLVEHGLYVRDCSNKVGMDRFHIRVASQGRDNDRRLVAALPQVLADTD
jgi:histidinol-phosphate/aromatic aminotransferase/cobyric acid decarboxylase-like protein